MQGKLILQVLNLEPTAKGSVLKFDIIIYSKSLNSEWGTSPHSSGTDIAIIARSIVLAFRLRSRHPVRPKGRTAYNGNVRLMLNGFFISYFTEPTGEGRFLPIVYARQFYSPTYTTPPTSASLTVGLGSAWLWWANWLA